MTLLVVLAGPGVSSAAARSRWIRVANLGRSVPVEQDTVGMVTAPDGKLHVAWLRPQASDGTYSYGGATISPSGKLLARRTALSSWASLGPDPRMVRNGRGLRLIFEGNMGRNECFANGGVFTATSKTGRSWSGPRSMSYATTPGVAGIAATTEADGTPVAAFEGGDLFHVGVDSSCPASSPDGTLTPAPDTSQSDPALVTDPRDGSVWLAWLQSDQRTTGPWERGESYWVQRILPTPSKPVQAPSSSASASVSSQYEPAPVVARVGGGVFMAYCLVDAKLRCTHVVLWRVGSSQVLTVPGSGTPATGWAVTLAAAPAGRLAIAWASGNDDKWSLHAVRTNPRVTSFGTVRTVRVPRGRYVTTVQDIQAEASSARLNVVIDDRVGRNLLYYTQIRF